MIMKNRIAVIFLVFMSLIALQGCVSTGEGYAASGINICRCLAHTYRNAGNYTAGGFSWVRHRRSGNRSLSRAPNHKGAVCRINIQPGRIAA